MSRNPKVVFILNNTLAIGGVERKIVDISQYLSNQFGAETLVVYLILDDRKSADPQEGVFYDVVNNSTVRILYKPQKKLYGFEYLTPFYLLWKVYTLHPDILLSFLRRSSIISVFLKKLFFWRTIRVVISEDNVPSSSLTMDIRSLLKRKVFFSLIRLYYPRTDAIIAVSDCIKNDLVRTFSVPAEKIVVNKNWVLLSGNWKKNPKQYDLIFVGRIHQVKNLALLIEIINNVHKVVPCVRICFVGGGDDKEQLLQLTEGYSLGSAVTFAGFQSDVASYLSASRILCLTSRSEGLPLSALEAMACGLPVVTTSYPGAEELVHDGTNGYICVDKSEYLSRVMELLSNERLRLKMGEQAQSYVRSHHGLQNLKAFVEILLGESQTAG